MQRKTLWKHNLLTEKSNGTWTTDLIWNQIIGEIIFWIFNLFKDNMIIGQEYFVKGDTTTQLSYATFKPRFKKLLKELGIQEHTIHDTRHTFATMLNNANANSTSIIRLIGHSNFSTTENIYTHKDTEELRKAVELLN